MGRDFIYARVSTEDQTVESQIDDLLQYYPKAIVIPEIQSTRKQRPGLEGLLLQLQRGDRVIVTALDRIARSMKEMINIFDILAEKEVTLITKREGTLDQSTPTGKMFIQLLSTFAEFERNIISERTKAGLSHRRAQGMKLGRKPKYTESDWERVNDLCRQGYSVTQIAQETGISVPSVSRHLKAHG